MTLTTADIAQARAFLEELKGHLPAFPDRSPALRRYTDRHLEGMALLAKCVDQVEAVVRASEQKQGEAVEQLDDVERAIGGKP